MLNGLIISKTRVRTLMRRFVDAKGRSFLCDRATGPGAVSWYFRSELRRDHTLGLLSARRFVPDPAAGGHVHGIGLSPLTWLRRNIVYALVSKTEISARGCLHVSSMVRRERRTTRQQRRACATVQTA